MSNHCYITEECDLKYIDPPKENEVWTIFEKHRGKRVFNVPNDPAFCVSNPEFVLKSAYDKMEAQQRDRIEDWMRIQDAERKCEKLEAENYRIRCEKQSDLNKIAELEFNENQAHAKIKQLEAENKILIEILMLHDASKRGANVDLKHLEQITIKAIEQVKKLRGENV